MKEEKHHFEWHLNKRGSDCLKRVNECEDIRTKNIPSESSFALKLSLLFKKKGKKA